MQLENAIVALWIIASMLACWAFSLIVRLLAERRTRVRKQLTTNRSRRSVWLALLLVLICAGGAAVSGGAAQWISSQPNVSHGQLTPLGAVALGMVLFACFLTTWAAIGDRSHGRLRCPRCWYDMQSSIGYPCPECGREIHDEQQLRKSRRPRWAFVTAGILLAFGATGLGFNARYRNLGALGFVPQQVLISMWRSLPDSWVYETGVGPRNDDLVSRITSGRVSDDTRHALAIELLDEMLDNDRLRWDTRRLELLDAILLIEVFDQSKDLSQPGEVWLPADQRVERLYAAAMDDLARYHAEDPTLMGSDLAAEINSQIFSSGPTAGFLTRKWILSHRFGSPQSYYSYTRDLTAAQVDTLRQTLGETASAIEAIDSDRIYRTGDSGLMSLIMTLELESGVLRDRVDGMLNAYATEPEAYTPYYLVVINQGIGSLHDSHKRDALQVVEEWLIDGNLELRLAALNLISMQYHVRWGGRSENSAEINRWLELIELHGVGDDRVQLVEDMRFARSVSQIATTTILSLDATGEHALRIIVDELLDPASDQYALNQYRWPRIYEDSAWIGNWVEIMEPLVSNPDSEVRLWIARTTPHYAKSAYEDRIRAMLDTLLLDPNPIVQDEAFTRANERGYR